MKILHDLLLLTLPNIISKLWLDSDRMMAIDTYCYHLNLMNTLRILRNRNLYNVHKVVSGCKKLDPEALLSCTDHRIYPAFAGGSSFGDKH